MGGARRGSNGPSTDRPARRGFATHRYLRSIVPELAGREGPTAGPHSVASIPPTALRGGNLSQVTVLTELGVSESTALASAHRAEGGQLQRVERRTGEDQLAAAGEHKVCTHPPENLLLQMNRRAFVRGAGGTALLAASAGCLFGAAGGNRLELTPVDSLAGYAATQPAEFSAAQHRLVDEAHPEGDHITYGHRPFPGGAYLQVEGGFYRATLTESGTKQLTRTVLGATEIGDASDAVAVDEYPEGDRKPAMLACRLSIVRARESDRDDAPPARYVYVFRTTPANESSLLPTPRHEVVEYQDQTFRLWVEERDLTETEYTTTLGHIAGSTATFERAIQDEYVIDLDEHALTDAQRDIVETAIEEGAYTEQGQISDALDDLITLLRDERPREDAVLRYDDAYYTWDYSHSD